MNILTGIVPTPELQEAAALATNYQAKYDDLQDRLVSQRSIANRASVELRELVMARKWDTSDSPEGAAEARKDCTQASERYRQERQLLEAIETAAANAEVDVSRAGNQVFTIISQLVSSQFRVAVIDRSLGHATAA